MEEYEIKENNPESKDNEDILQLGDTLIILGGTLAGTRGKVYFVNDDKIRIMP